MTTFYSRLLQVIDNKGFKNINSFALSGLKYDSSSKLARLKDGNKKPSLEILEDIANKFEDVNLNWLVTGNGQMLNNSEDKAGQNTTNVVSEPGEVYVTAKDELLEMQRQLIKLQNEKIAELHAKLERLQEPNKV